MNTGSIITGIVLLLICALPFVIYNVYNKNKKNKFLQMVTDQASEFGAKPTKMEYWHGTAVGMDENKGMFFLLRKVNDQLIKSAVPLQTMKQVRIIRTEKNSAVGSSTNGISRIELAFTPKEKDKPDVLIEFYNAEYDSVSFYHEQQLIEKWHAITSNFVDSSNRKT